MVWLWERLWRWSCAHRTAGLVKGRSDQHAQHDRCIGCYRDLAAVSLACAFESFAEFSVALPPNGLGARSIRPLKLLRYALLTNGHLAHWTEVMERTMRVPGRPRQNLVNEEGFERF